MERNAYVVVSEGQAWYVQCSAEETRGGPFPNREAALWYAVTRASQDDFAGYDAQVLIKQHGELRVEQTYGY